MKSKNNIQSEQSKINNSNSSQIINKSNLNNLENSLSCSNLLTSNNIKQKLTEKLKSKEKENENENDKKKDISQEIIKESEKSKSNIENKSNNALNLKRTVNNIIVDNKFLSRSGVKERKKKIDNDVALYQDFIIDGYNNALSNNKKNLIERLGECIEKKHQTINFWKKNYKKIEKLEESHKIPKEKLFKEYKNYQKSMFGTGFVNDPKTSSLYGNGYYTNISKKMKHSYSTSNILDKKNSGDFPLLLNAPITYIKKFSSYSEKERNEKNILALLKLKHFLNMYWKQRKEIVKEFFNKYNLNDPLLFKDINLDHFANYVNDNISDDNDISENNCDIETRLPMIDIINKGIKYKPYLNMKKNKNEIKNNINKKFSKFKKNKTRITINNLSRSTDELSKEKEYLDSLITKDKITKYKSFLNRNYKTSVINKLLKGLTKEEKLNYFSKKKYGQVEIRDKNNLANNLEKQALYIRRFNAKSNKFFNKSSIKYYNNDDLKKLNDELNFVSYSIVKKFESESMKKNQEKILGDKKYKGLNDKIIDKLNQRLYYTIKEKYHLSHPEVIPTQKKKLLEYIIALKVQERKNFEQKLLDDSKKI